MCDGELAAYLYVTIASGGVRFYLLCFLRARLWANLGAATVGLPHAHMARTREAVGSQAIRAHSSGEEGHENH